MADSSDPRGALAGIFGGLQSTFKRYDRSARRRAWDAVLSGQGKEQVNKLINNPSHQVIGLPKLLKFKEWLAQNEN